MAPVEQRLLLSQASGGRQCDAAAGKWASKLAHYPAAHAGTVDMDALSLAVRTERWPIAGSFAISRGAKTEATVVVAELTSGPHRVRGECVPYARYGETVEGVVAAVETMRPLIEQGLDRLALQGTMPPGAARNALDCAFWDLAAKRAGKPAHELAGLAPPKPLVTAYTISLDTPKAMAAAAAGAADRKLLKVKLGGEGDRARIEAVRRAAPASELIVDANEGWTQQNLTDNLAACEAAGVTLIEQPLPAGQDDVLSTFRHPIPICADESAHAGSSLAALARRYDAVNIKLDKTGGLTGALATAEEAARLGLTLMVGCMVATSLSMAPAMLVAQRARLVDLDGALLLARDRPDGLRYDGSLVHPPSPALWG
jgi:L-alanine-DL-glutamate epimerase-like enolase superfamily enzyme